MRDRFEIEVREQPIVLGRLLAQGRATAERIAARVRAEQPAFAVLAARGSSDNAARYGQYLLGVRHRMVVSLAAPSILTQYGAAPRLAGALVIGISQSGQSPDVVAVIDEGRRQGALTLAITNEPDSPLGQAAELTFPLQAGPERAVAATKTYSGQLVALAMLSAALDGDEAAWSELHSLPEQVAEAIHLNRSRARVSARFRRRRRLVVVGRGYNLSTAFEIALKVKEACGVLAEPYSSADFLHGPVALLDRGLPVMVVACAGGLFDDLRRVVELARESGARLIAVSDAPELLEAADVALPLPSGVPEWLSPVVAVVPGQLWAQSLARARGLTADRPRGLSKVTLTR